MFKGPFDNHRFGSFGQFALNNLQRFDQNDGLVFPIISVKMGRIMVIVIHPYQNAEEFTDGWHGPSVAHKVSYFGRPIITICGQVSY